MQQHNHPLFSLRDGSHRIMHTPGMCRRINFQQINHCQRFMHTHQHLFAGIPCSLYQREMRHAGNFIMVGNQSEFSVNRSQGTFRQPCNQAFREPAIVDKIGNRTNLKMMFIRKFKQIWQPCHFTVFFQDFANHSRFCQAGQTPQITTCLSMAGARQHAPLLRFQRKNMTRLNQIFRLCICPDSRLNSTRTIRSGNTGCHTAGCFNGCSEIGAQR